MPSKEADPVSVRIKPWYGLEAMARDSGVEKMLYLPKELRKFSIPTLVSTFCLPGGSKWGEAGLTRQIQPELGFRMVNERLSAMQWVTKQFAKAPVTIYLCDDDLKYCFTEGTDEQVIHQLQQKLMDELSQVVTPNIEVKTVTELVEQLGLDYMAIQSEILSRISIAKNAGSKILGQLPGWLKAIMAIADGKVEKIQGSYGVKMSEADVQRVYKPLIGVAIQGMALRKRYQTKECLYMATIPNSVEEFWELDIKAMMEPQLDQTGFLGAIPAVFCPEGQFDFQKLEAITARVAAEMNPAPHAKPVRATFDYQRIENRRTKPKKACDDL